MQHKILFATIIACIAFSCNNQNNSSRKEVKQYSASQLYNNETIFGIAFAPDESKVLVNSDKSGIQNLYVLTIADTSMQPLTHSVKESFYGIDYLPATTDYLYASDQGGNENDHIFLATANDTAKDITPWQGSKNSMHSWSTDKKSIFIESNRRNPKYFDLWKADTSNWNFKLFYQNDSGYNVGAISKSERYIALTKDITTDKNDLYLLDRIKHSTKRISNDHPATWYVAAF
jgi:hypothetical protein